MSMYIRELRGCFLWCAMFHLCHFEGVFVFLHSGTVQVLGQTVPKPLSLKGWCDQVLVGDVFVSGWLVKMI